MVSATWSAACYHLVLELQKLDDYLAYDQATYETTDMFKSNDLMAMLSAQSATGHEKEVFLKDEGLIRFLKDLCDLGFDVKREYEGVVYSFRRTNNGK
jgi:hypothetical protein